MGFIAMIIMGLLVGMAAGFIMKTNYPWYIDILLGIVGAIVGGWLSSILLGVDLTGGFNLTTFLVSLVGALIVIALVRLFTRRRTA